MQTVVYIFLLVPDIDIVHVKIQLFHDPTQVLIYTGKLFSMCDLSHQFYS